MGLLLWCSLVSTLFFGGFWNNDMRVSVVEFKWWHVENLMSCKSVKSGKMCSPFYSTELWISFEWVENIIFNWNSHTSTHKKLINCGIGIFVRVRESNIFRLYTQENLIRKQFSSKKNFLRKNERKSKM